MSSTTDPKDVRCERCGNVTLDVVQVPSVLTREGIQISYYDEFSKCLNCGDEFYTYEQSMARSRAITDALRKSSGLPTGAEIRETRLKLGMSLPEFERAMGVGKKTIGRWERGTVPPTAAANIGLWLARNYPRIFEEYAQSKGVASHVTRFGASGQTSQGPSAARRSLGLIQGGRSIIRTNYSPGIEAAFDPPKESVEA